jgi:predicted ATP-dependent serine protease
VSGEAGIGKTTLIDAFLFGVRSSRKFGVEEEEENQKAKGKNQKAKINASTVDLDPRPPESSIPQSAIPNPGGVAGLGAMH